MGAGGAAGCGAGVPDPFFGDDFFFFFGCAPLPLPLRFGNGLDCSSSSSLSSLLLATLDRLRFALVPRLLPAAYDDSCRSNMFLIS